MRFKQALDKAKMLAKKNGGIYIVTDEEKLEGGREYAVRKEDFLGCDEAQAFDAKLVFTCYPDGTAEDANGVRNPV